MNTTSAVQGDRIILALLQHGQLEKAAAALGLSTATIWRRLKKPEFQERLRKARAEAFSEATGRLTYSTNVAVDTVLEIMNDKSEPAAIRLRAAAYVLDFANKTTGDFGARIEVVEEALKRAA